MAAGDGRRLLDEPAQGRELGWFQAGSSDVIPTQAQRGLCHARPQVHLATSRKIMRLRREVRIDSLIQVPSHSELERVAVLEWRRGLRSKLPLSVLMIDVDRFKAYNDHFGHLQGDGALRHVAAAIASACVRASDTVARCGGEELAAILPDTDAEAGALVGAGDAALIQANRTGRNRVVAG